MAEKEYIERVALIEAWERESAEATDLFDAFDFALEDVPAADVVEVVRCEDCKHCKKHPTTDTIKMCVNHQWVMECYPLVHDNDFCSYGERKEDNR